MPVYLCTWEDRAALAIDDVSREAALEVATEEAEGTAPSTIRELPPRFFVVSVAWASEDEEEDGDPDDDYLVIEMVVEKSEAELVRMLDEAPSPALAVPVPAAAVVVGGPSTCDSEAEADDGRVVRCSRAKGHEGAHHADGLAWDT